MEIELFGCRPGGKAVEPHRPPLYPTHPFAEKFFREHLEWWGGRYTRGILDLGQLRVRALAGRCLATFTFEPAELRNWLENYIDTNPQEALELLAELLPKALAARNKVKE